MVGGGRSSWTYSSRTLIIASDIQDVFRDRQLKGTGSHAIEQTQMRCACSGGRHNEWTVCLRYVVVRKGLFISSTLLQVGCCTCLMTWRLYSGELRSTSPPDCYPSWDQERRASHHNDLQRTMSSRQDITYRRLTALKRIPLYQNVLSGPRRAPCMGVPKRSENAVRKKRMPSRTLSR